MRAHRKEIEDAACLSCKVREALKGVYCARSQGPTRNPIKMNMKRKATKSVIKFPMQAAATGASGCSGACEARHQPSHAAAAAPLQFRTSPRLAHGRTSYRFGHILSSLVFSVTSWASTRRPKCGTCKNMGQQRR